MAVWTTPKTWNVGDILTAGDMNIYVRDNSTYLHDVGPQGMTYTAYTPVWGSAGVAPVLNNGTITGRYLRVGKMVHSYLILTAGTTTTFGNGIYNFTIPVASAASMENIPVGVALADDIGLVPYSATAFISSGKLIVFTPAAPGVYWTNTVPFTFGNGDFLAVSATYEAA